MVPLCPVFYDKLASLSRAQVTKEVEISKELPRKEEPGDSPGDGMLPCISPGKEGPGDAPGYAILYGI